jgi:LacI family transcriptional regulator
LAVAAGLHRVTVTKALRDDPSISEATRERVRKLAAEIGYRPNASARAMRAGKFGTVALVLSAHPGRSYLPERALRGICQTLSDRELQLTIAQLPDEKLTDAGFVPRLLREYCCDGMLIDYTDHIPDRMIELIEQLRQPAIWLNRKQDHDCVYPDDLAMGREATRRLLAAGHRRIAYVDWGAGWKQLDQAHYSQRDRQAGYEAAMRDAGLTCRIVRREDSTIDSSAEELMALIGDLVTGADAPTAFVTYSWPFGRRIAAAVMRRQRRVPQDVSLVTISEQRERLDDGTYVDTEIVPTHAYGVAGVQAVLDKLDEPQKRLAPRAVAPEPFAKGQSVAMRRPSG